MIDIVAKVAEVASKTVEKLSEVSSEIKDKVSNLDAPLNKDKARIIECNGESLKKISPKELDSPLNSNCEKNDVTTCKDSKSTEGLKGTERMESQIKIEFKCPEGMDKKEFTRQIKGQERGLNSQTIAENMDNRAAYEQRKAETGNGRDTSEGKKAQDIARDKAMHSRIESNQKNGMSYSEAKKEAEDWISTQAALHNPDQIAGGDPTKVSRMGDANVNSSIGAQWKSRVEQLSDAIEDYAKDKTRDELENTKLNVKLTVV